MKLPALSFLGVLGILGCVPARGPFASSALGRAPAPPACVDPAAHYQDLAARRIARLPPGIRRPPLRLTEVTVLDLDDDGAADLGEAVPGLHGAHSIAPGAVGLYVGGAACRRFVGELDADLGGRLAVDSARHAGLHDLISTVNAACQDRGPTLNERTQYRWRFDGTTYRVAGERACDCRWRGDDGCAPWR
jgi:hypothetical protein